MKKRKKQLSQKTIRILRKIKEMILEKPERFDMDSWLQIDNKVAPCGTAACIGGYAVMVTNPKLKKLGWKRTGHSIAKFGVCLYSTRRAVGFSDDVAGVTLSRRLFYTANMSTVDENHWPHDLSAAYHTAFNAGRYRLAAEIACIRIDRFINSDGKE